MGSLAGFAHRLLVEFDGPSKWEVLETGKAPEPPNSRIGVWARPISAVSARQISASFSSDVSSSSQTRFPF